MLKAQSAETCYNIRSVHITFLTYPYRTPTHLLINGFDFQHGTLHQSLELQKSYTEAHRIAALSNFDCRFSPRY